MVDEAKFFEGVRTGEYNLPKSLRGLFILAVNNQDERFLVVRMYSRPTTVEDTVKKYRLQGIIIKLESKINVACSVFDMSYKITIEVKPFLANLNIFRETCKVQHNLVETPDDKDKSSVEDVSSIKRLKPEEHLIYRKRII